MTDKHEIRPGQSVELLKELHILTRDGRMNQDSRRKLKQVYHLYRFIEPLLQEIQEERGGVQLVDVGAGKSYLGFILHDLFFKERGGDSRIFGIETRAELVARGRELAARLGFAGMRFLDRPMAEAGDAPELPARIDIVTALHACNTATDDAIRFALRRQAKFIVLVPCCQAEVAALLRKHKGEALSHAVAELWRHPIHTPVGEYPDRLKAAFSSPGLHDFLQCLRNYNTHWRIAQANWVIHHDFNSHSRAARFTVTKPELLAWDGWTAKAKEFIESAPDTIDIYDLFFEYRKHVQSFYAWHKGAVLEVYAQVLQPYFEYKRLYEGIQKKYSWNLIISHAPKTLNPFQYLDQYLPRHQIERLLAYDHRSDEQVDALIRMLDMEEFCDEALRAKVLALFRPAT